MGRAFSIKFCTRAKFTRAVPIFAKCKWGLYYIYERYKIVPTSSCRISSLSQGCLEKLISLAVGIWRSCSVAYNTIESFRFEYEYDYEIRHLRADGVIFSCRHFVPREEVVAVALSDTRFLQNLVVLTTSQQGKTK